MGSVAWWFDRGFVSKKHAKLNNQIDSKLKSRIEQKKRALGIKTDHSVKDVKNDDQNLSL